MKKTKEELITAIRDILAGWHTTEVRWADMSPDYSPILQEDKFSSENTFGVDYVGIDGVDGSSSWDNGFWSWDELPIETIQQIYNTMSEYEFEED